MIEKNLQKWPSSKGKLTASKNSKMNKLAKDWYLAMAKTNVVRAPYKDAKARANLAQAQMKALAKKKK